MSGAIMDDSARDTVPPQKWHRVSAVVGSVVLFLLFASYGAVYNYHVRFGVHLADISEGEYRLWLAGALLMTPATVLLAYGSSDLWGPLASRFAQRWGQLTSRQVITIAALCAVLLVPIYRIGRWFLLRDHAVTDDETMIRFGGQILAMGQLSAEKLWPAGTLTELFTVTTNGRIFSMDWPGGLVFCAFTQVTGVGAWGYAAAAAITMWAIVATGQRLFGNRGALLAGLGCLVSPMAWTLSLTVHTHILSRMFVALAMLAMAHLWGARDAASKPKLGWAVLLGASVGLSVATRPYETTSLMGPSMLFLAWLALRHRGHHFKQACVVAASALPFLLLYAAYNYAQTGSPFLTPREVPWATDANFGKLSIWQRLGQNLTHNFLMLGVWVVGLAGWPLAYLGSVTQALEHRALRLLLLLGVLGQLGIALGHENVGIHMVGPIHYSEALPFLLILITAGLLRLSEWLSSLGLSQRAVQIFWGGQLVMLCVVGGIYARALYGLGQDSEIIPNAVRAKGIHNAVVISPMPREITNQIPNSHGSWQLAHPPPHPKLTDDVIYTYSHVPVATLRAGFPDRRLYRATFDAVSRQLRIVPVDDPPAKKPPPRSRPPRGTAHPKAPKAAADGEQAE